MPPKDPENRASDPEITLSSTVQAAYAGASLLDYLCARFPYKDNAAWRAEIEAGRLKVNGKPGQAGKALKLKDSVAFTAPRREPEVARDIATLWQDEHLLVVNKPAPLPCHSDGVFIMNTLINMLRTRTKNGQLALGHRLDRETSGVLVLAKARATVSKLMAAFDDGGVEKWYLAVARGEAPWEEQLVRGWMIPKLGSQVSMRQVLSPGMVEGGKESATRFVVKERLKGHTLLACQPLTGRTNQIRVHLEAVGLPLAGDKMYGRSDEEFLAYVRHVKAGGDQGFEGKYESTRHLLHAWKLGLRHPVTGEAMKWEAGMPEDMEKFVKGHALPSA